jgi:hypothetical protein
MKCLAKSPDDRFASMEEVVAVLRPIQSIPPPASDSTRAAAPVVATRSVATEPPAAARQRAWSLVAATAGAFACVGLVAALVAPRRQPALAPAPPQTAIVPHPPPPPVPSALLHIETDPAGAKVKEEGDTVCESTPCDVVYRGALADPGYEHLLMFLKADYKLERKIVRASASPLSVKLSKAR